MNQCYSCTTCKSADKPLECYIAGLPMETSHHRVEGQSVKCGFGLQGVCCRLCSNGPCRITPEAPHGICGASADVIVARNFLRAVAAGSGCYIHVVETTALNLKETALSGGALKGMNALEHLCQLFAIPQGDPHTRAAAVAQAVLDDLYLPDYTPMKLQQKLSYAPRLAKWNELGILPGGAKSEVCAGVVKCSTNLNSDPTDMLLHCLKLGISTGVYGLMLTNLLNDVMLGEPEITPAPVGLGVIDPDYINIMITGHQHSIFVHLQEQLKKPEVQELAKAAGARGFRLVGCSNLTAGGHDVLTVELTRELIARDILVLTAGCSSGGLENCGLMTPEAASLAGPKLRAVCESLGIPPVLNFGPCLAIGRLEMVATELAQALNVDIPQLPLVLSAAQWLEEQALADGAFGLALGLPLHLGLPPFITGSSLVTKILTEDMKALTGGQVIVNSHAGESADILEQIIMDKRQALNI